MRLLLAALASVLVAAAGCLSDSARDGPGPDASGAFAPFTPPEPAFDFSTVVDPDHVGHSLPDLHAAGHGLDLVGHAGVQDVLPTGTQGSITAVDVWGDYAVVAGMQGGLAFVILDISDPADPRPVGWAPSAAEGWTARFSDDGQYVFYGCQMAVSATGNCQDPDQPTLPVQNPPGVSVWDVSDKSDPRYVTFLAAGGSHNIFAANIGGEDYVFTSSTEILHFDRATRTLRSVFELPGRHDVTVAQHPVTGDWLLFTGTGELAIYDVDDPTAPEVVFEGTGDEGWEGWHDQVLVPGLVDGRAVLLLAGESFLGTGGEALPDVISVVDVTDPAAPVLLGQWQPPFRPLAPWASYLFSVHEMAATPTGQVAIAWYHAGVWVIDVSTEARMGGPATLAAYQPHEGLNVLPSTYFQTPVPYVPMVWAVGWTADGHLVVPDMHTGVYVLEPAWGLRPALDSGQ
jgi:hypothetical protein